MLQFGKILNAAMDRDMLRKKHYLCHTYSYNFRMFVPII